jgi:ATP-binding cassette, subfamily B, multidrug efflux pump
VKDLQALIPYLRPYRALIGWGLLMVVLANLFSLAAPYLIREAIDALTAAGASRSVILRYAALVVLAALLGGSARFAMRQILNGVSRRVELDLRNDLFRRLLQLDAYFYARMPTGEIMSRATNDIQAVRMTAGPAYMYLVNTTVMTVFAVTLMVWIDPWLTLVALLPLLALPPVTLGFGQLIHTRFEKIQEQFGTLSTMAQENLAGARIVKAYGRESQQSERFRALSEEYLHRNMRLARVSGLFHPILGFLSGMAMVVVLLVGVRSVMAGTLSLGDFVAFTLYLGMLSWPMIALGWVVNLFQRGAASMRRINAVLTSTPGIADHPEPVDLPEIRGEIEFRNVSFRYPGAREPVLRHLSFTVPAGSRLAIVGATASGKSTLVNLMVRLFDPTEGVILLDGVPLPRIPLARLRGAIGIVPQDTFLFSDTIRANLGIGLEDEPEVGSHAEQAIVHAASVARLNDTIEELPGAYDTLLGERGVNLSGGQKQRAALARAIARDPRVLILDDALSAVDTHTEAEILAGLREVMRERTSIVVSHRVSAVVDADEILVLDDGRVTERGTHAQLLAQNGVYTALQHRQLLSEDLEGDAILADDSVET